MTKLLNGAELVGYIEERQARQVRALRQASRIFPRLVIIKSTTASPVVDTYIRLKQRYGQEILIETVVETVAESDMSATIARLNNDPMVHGIIVQLPLADMKMTDDIVNQIAPEKDVDGLGDNAQYDSATATAINWLLAGYAVDLANKTIAIVGNGRLVGAPLAKIWQSNGYAVTVLDDTHVDIASVLRKSDVIVSATGVPRLITSDMIQIGAVVVDAGTASENGVITGDVDATVRQRDDLTITPEKGGVGPLTIAALCDNVIQAALRVAEDAE
ncbi:MAG TPA: bifunctional 5,10-methylenetetrahydrofolate dehydrogenase/5,10-methenyltetrahydrofolate cyclohydrolase [Candidatus Saccharimonadales bacterium]|nr:bifunctional 5,10-methylenetetrahydrofolate dehydrogenase/5,10-methenyltetrahydrofolate cyclohydrolase [Candidatus Saccharimonadales bacterium]